MAWQLQCTPDLLLLVMFISYFPVMLPYRPEKEADYCISGQPFLVSSIDRTPEHHRFVWQQLVKQVSIIKVATSTSVPHVASLFVGYVSYFLYRFILEVEH